MEFWWVAPDGTVKDAYWYLGAEHWITYELAPAGSASPQSGIAAVSRVPDSLELWWVAPDGAIQGAHWYGRNQ